MAITKIHAIKSTLGKALAYIENPDKTDGQMLVSGYNCEPQTASIDFEMTAVLAHKARNLKRKRSTNLAYHLIQSFSPEDAVTPEQAHELGKKLAFEYTGGKYEYVVATHIDKGHMTEIQNLIDDGVLITYSLCPYERDLERYGGPQIYEDAENVFCLNSNIVASFFLLPTEANELKTILLGIYVISDIMSAFGLTLKQQEVVLNSIVHPKEHRDFYRKNRSRYIECIEAADLRLTENLFTTPLSTVLREHFETVCKYVVKIELLDSQMQLCNSKQDIIYSLIHMFCNRLFQDSRFERYALAVLRHCIHDINQKRAKLYTLNK